MATARKKNRVLFYLILDFHMINSLLIAFYAVAKYMLTSLSVDEMLLPKYMNWSTNFRGLPLKSRDGSFLFKTHELCFIDIHTVG